MSFIKQEYKKYIGTNPYKGFVPFIGEYNLDSSMEFFYIPLNKILISKIERVEPSLESLFMEVVSK